MFFLSSLFVSVPVPDISAKLFQLLDTRKKGYFTTQDLQQVRTEEDRKTQEEGSSL
jgi:Ca2+-binding EF-hand superfamily protein